MSCQPSKTTTTTSEPISTKSASPQPAVPSIQFDGHRLGENKHETFAEDPPTPRIAALKGHGLPDLEPLPTAATSQPASTQHSTSNSNPNSAATSKAPTPVPLGAFEAMHVVSLGVVDCTAPSPMSIHVASMLGQVSAVQRLLQLDSHRLDTFDEAGMTPLHYACLCGNLPIVTLLVSRGASVHNPDRMGNSPLHLACGASSMPSCVDMARALLDCGADVNVLTPMKRTPLHLVGNNPRLAAFLLERGGTMSLQDVAGSNALHVASLLGAVDVMLVFIEHGAELTTVDLDKETALHKAVRNGSVDAVKALLHRGAAPLARDRNGQTPLDLALSQPRLAPLCELLQTSTNAAAHAAVTPLPV